LRIADRLRNERQRSSIPGLAPLDRPTGIMGPLLAANLLPLLTLAAWLAIKARASRRFLRAVTPRPALAPSRVAGRCFAPPAPPGDAYRGRFG
jgi:hypothetical protein